LVSNNKNSSATRVAPGYRKIRQWILDYIAQNRLEPGDRLPSYRAISSQLDVNRGLVAKAVVEMVEEGLLSGQQGNGTFVAERIRQARPRSTRTVAVMMPFIDLNAAGALVGETTIMRLEEPFYRTNVSGGIASGINSVLQEMGYRLVVHSNPRTPEQALILDSLLNESLDGVIAIPQGSEESATRFADLKEAGLPFVFVDRYFPQVPIDRVITDNFGGARDAVRHLISRGHRRIAYFTNFVELTSIWDREEGYRTALEEAGIAFDEGLVFGPALVRGNRWTYTYALEHCLRMSPPVAAVFGMNDDMVWATLQAARQLGLSIPGDLEVAGFFDSPVPHGMEVPFARLVQDKFQMGQLAARLLLQRVRGEGPEETQHILVPAELIPAQDSNRSQLAVDASMSRRWSAARLAAVLS
jgi:GntR family transcriptional regulator, arabinose operon transcriptional repressor